jgi:plasmid stabilization system protein ParE
VTRFAALESSHNGIGCTTMPPIPAEDARLNRTQEAESEMAGGPWERLVPGPDRPQDLAGVAGSIREVIHGNYRIVYRPRDDVVEIATVFHGARLFRLD